MTLPLPLVMHEPWCSDALASPTVPVSSTNDVGRDVVMNSMAESACNMIDEQPASSGNPLPDLAWVETLFAALGAGHSANDAMAATSVCASESLIDTVVAEEAEGLSAPLQVDDRPVDDQPIADALKNEVESEVMSTAATSSLALPEQCLLRDAVEMKATMVEHAAANDMTVDISAVERVDAAFVQVLVALVKQRQGQGKALPAWQGSSAALSEAARVLGLNELMKFPAA